METWRIGDIDMETETWRDEEIETWRHEDMEKWNHQKENGKRQNGSPGNFP
jgi:hypothetical protein